MRFATAIKMIRIRLWTFILIIDKEKFIFLTITDQGEGFDWKTLQRAALPEDEDYGRGIHIMETYFTRYSYNPKGNILYLEKEISA